MSQKYPRLVGGLEHEFYVSIQLGIIIPTDELIFFRGVGIPPTRRSRIQGVRARSTDIAVQVVATAGSGESKLQFHVPIKV